MSLSSVPVLKTTSASVIVKRPVSFTLFFFKVDFSFGRGGVSFFFSTASDFFARFVRFFAFLPSDSLDEEREEEEEEEESEECFESEEESESESSDELDAAATRWL